VQNSGNAKLRGTDTDAFHCHTEVMDYALGHHCRSLAIESVMGAYEAAHESYEEAALKYGYRVNYIMCNSASFGVPQWRERIWTVFHQVPKRQPFKVDFKPHYVTLGSILNPNGTEWPLGNSNAAKVWEKVSPLITKKWTTGCSIMKSVQDAYDIPSEPNFAGARRKFGFSGFVTSHPKLIDHNGFSPVILFDLFLADGQRRLTIEEYCSIMGFPRDYKWGKRQKQFRMYLSKGVCPPVAAWILKTVDRNASGWVGKRTHSEEDFGGVIDLRPKKVDALMEARR
jgi:site-specific DNA-cytosine methylase